MNKKQIDLLSRHYTSNEGNLFDAYARPSQAKKAVWQMILDDARKLPFATRPKVNSFNTFMFTASFEYEKDGKRRLRYYNPSETFDFEIE